MKKFLKIWGWLLLTIFIISEVILIPGGQIKSWGWQVFVVFYLAIYVVLFKYVVEPIWRRENENKK